MLALCARVAHTETDTQGRVCLCVCVCVTASLPAPMHTTRRYCVAVTALIRPDPLSAVGVR